MLLLLDPCSLVVNAEMAPGFHILVYAKTDQASALFSPILAHHRRASVTYLTEVVEIWMLEYPV